MISTITSTVTTITILSMGVLGALGTVLLIVLLSTKEVMVDDGRSTLKTFGKSLDISIYPLLIVFTLIAAFKIIDFL